MDFRIRRMVAVDAEAIAAWRYPGEYSFYDADADVDDLAELLDPTEWGRRYFAADELTGHELVGFLVVKLSDRVAEIGLGLRPDLTGLGLGESLSAPVFVTLLSPWARRAIRSLWRRSIIGQ